MKPQTTPKDFFIHVAAVIALYATAISLINLLFQVIDISFPDKLDYYVDPYSSAIRWSIAMIAIAFPVFILLQRTIDKSIKNDQGKLEIFVRRWLSYLTVFIAGLVIAIDLVTLLYKFLGGEISSRFLLKVAAVLVVSAVIFGYYFADIKRKTDSQTKYKKYYGYSSVLLVIVSLVVGFIVMGSPSEARSKRFDETRISNLSEIQWRVVEYWQRKQSLPTNLDLLNDDIGGFRVPTDPESGNAYKYSIKAGNTFELCATFSLQSDASLSKTSMPYYAGFGDNWNHEAGEVCFERTIDPVKYPPIKAY
jgi:hypothetical protein